MSTHQVILLPSKHHFLTSSKQSLLHAGLESGLNLKYGCDGGNCGECMIKLVSGNLHSIQHSDFVLSAIQKRQQHYLSCCHAAISDVQIEALEISSVSEIPEQNIQAKVYKMERLSDDVMSIALKTPRSQPLHFFAGQHVTLTLDQNISRNKSIASCPCDGLKPEFHVKKRKGDAFSEYVFNHLKKNTPVQMNGPWGNFVMDDDSTRPQVLIAFDTGFASIKSLIEHAIALEKEQPINFYWLMTPENQPYMENYCRSIAHALDNFHYQPMFIKERSKGAIAKMVNEILQMEKAIKHSDVYVTLPVECRAEAETMLIKAGIDDRHWRIDSIRRI